MSMTQHMWFGVVRELEVCVGDGFGVVMCMREEIGGWSFGLSSLCTVWRVGVVEDAIFFTSSMEYFGSSGSLFVSDILRNAFIIVMD